ncbi:MAG: hypothetical protein R2697_07380 [Ilumatobacteraceae bacterium]
MTEPTGHFTHDLDPTQPVATRSSRRLGHHADLLDDVDDPRDRTRITGRTRLSQSHCPDRHADRRRARSPRPPPRPAAWRSRLTREATGSELLSGRPDRARFDALVAAGFLPADVDEAFLCGPIELTDIARMRWSPPAYPASRSTARSSRRNSRAR